MLTTCNNRYCYRVPAAVQGLDLPKVISELTGNEDIASKANCWNSTLRFLGVDVPLRWEYGYNMESWIKHNTRCSHVSLRYGDILYIYGSGDYGISHTAVYVGNGWYWHKNGSYPAEFARLVRVLYYYPNDSWHHRRIIAKRDWHTYPVPKRGQK